ncbi:hypothetical protein [Streptomyces sp. NPDC058268]|uniref:hypothetical protein n=1 Tax=Streptomyces sp. NPDC058268 TaxID=3346413 RepID=UPI0036E90CE3
MIEYVPRSGPPEAMNCPTVVCDACREQVVDQGNIIWLAKVVRSDEATHEQSPLYAAHKGRCDRSLEAWLKKQHEQHEGQWILLWEELDDFLRQLSHNGANPFAADSEGTYHRAVIRHPKADPLQAPPI